MMLQWRHCAKRSKVPAFEDRLAGWVSDSVTVEGDRGMDHVARHPIANRAERTFERLRYSLGGNRPS